MAVGILFDCGADVRTGPAIGYGVLTAHALRNGLELLGFRNSDLVKLILLPLVFVDLESASQNVALVIKQGGVIHIRVNDHTGLLGVLSFLNEGLRAIGIGYLRIYFHHFGYGRFAVHGTSIDAHLTCESH